MGGVVNWLARKLLVIALVGVLALTYVTSWSIFEWVLERLETL